MARRMQSPSSINLFRQCPRKYFYQYILKLPIKENIHLVRGKLVHSVLEKFYDIDVSGITENNFVEEFTFYTKNMFNAYWNKENKAFQRLGLTPDKITFYYEESLVMVANWLNHVLEKTKKCIDSAKERGEHIDFKTIFEKVKPAVIEGNFRNEELQVRGFIDYIEHTEDGKVRVMDYKTSKKFQMTPAYRLQLAIYALMYKEKYGKHADKVGLFILKHGEKTIDVDDALVEEAKVAIEDIHYATESNEIKDYPKNITPLCKWSTGQCDFYDTCMKQGD